MYPPYAEEASAKTFLPPRCFTTFSPLKECDVHPAGTGTRASGRAGSPALAKVHRIKHQAAWNRLTRRAGESGGAHACRRRCVRMLTMTAGSSMAAMIFGCAPEFGQSASRVRAAYPDANRARTVPLIVDMSCRVTPEGLTRPTQLTPFILRPAPIALLCASRHQRLNMQLWST